MKVIPVEGNCITRSEAKRLIRRFDSFKEVCLDFNGISEIGQGFADELFRVFHLNHPEVDVTAINMTEDVQKMINRVK